MEGIFKKDLKETTKLHVSEIRHTLMFALDCRGIERLPTSCPQKGAC